jgi:hypothetical protein
MMMKVDDHTVPESVRAAIRNASAALPAQAWDLDAVRVRRRLRRTWGRRLTGIAAGVVAAVTAASAAIVFSGDGTVPRPAPDDPAVLLSVFSTDARHLYVLRADCDHCGPKLLGSDDSGATWTLRSDRVRSDIRITVGSTGAILAALRPSAAEGLDKDLGARLQMAVSADGGRTWLPVVNNPTPWTAPPAGGILGCDLGDCPMSMVDPATGRRSPMAQQPPAGETLSSFTVRGSIWLDRRNAGRESTTVTRDGGRNWSTASPACTDCNGRLVPGLDGTTVYRIPYGNLTSGTVIRRSTNAGVTWQSFPVTGPPTPAANPAGTGPTPDSYGTAAGIVAPDGTLITVRFASDGAVEAWTLAPAQTQPQAARLTGLPDHIGRNSSNELTGNADTGYLLWPRTGSTLYRSLDGRTWLPVLARP